MTLYCFQTGREMTCRFTSMTERALDIIRLSEWADVVRQWEEAE